MRSKELHEKERDQRPCVRWEEGMDRSGRGRGLVMCSGEEGNVNIKDKNSIRQTHHLLYGGYMFRPFIGSLSGLLWNQVRECCVHVGIPTMLTNSRKHNISNN
jgi:hypothetical protein